MAQSFREDSYYTMPEDDPLRYSGLGENGVFENDQNFQSINFHEPNTLFARATDLPHLSNPVRERINNLLNDPSSSNRRKLTRSLKKLSFVNNNRLSYVTNANETKYITLNNLEVVDNLIKQLRDGFTTETQESKESEGIDEFVHSKIKSFDFIISKNISRNGGHFFPYINTSKFDLRPFQIFKKGELEFNKHCIIYALERSEKIISKNNKIKYEKFTESEIRKISKLLHGSELPKRKLKEIGKLLDVQIHLRYLRKCKDEAIVDKINDKDKSLPIVKLSLYKGHYFKDQIVKYNNWHIENQDSDLIKYKVKSWQKIRCVDKHGKRKYSKEYKMSSLMFVHKLFKHGDFKEINFKDYYKEIEYYKAFPKKYKNCELYPEDFITFGKIKLSKITRYDHYGFADFEAYTNKKKHKPYMLCYNIMNKFDDFLKNKTKCITGKKCVTNFLEKIPHKSLIYFHNLKYDWQFIQPYLRISSSIIQNSNIYQMKCYYKKKEITFRCSWHMINSKLVDFPKMFGLNIKKEIFPYNFYTDKTTLTQESLLEDVLKFIKEKDKEEFIKIATEVDCIEKDEDDGKIYFYHMDYAKYYCSQDVNVLAEGFIKFRGWVLSQLNMDISNYTTIASLSHNYFIDKKCYEGVTKLYGSVRDFVQKSIVGGKVMMLDNKPLITYEPVKSVDGNSLYPSAINRIPGFPKGLPKLLKKLTKENLTKKDYYVVEVKITAVNNKSGSPCLSYVDDTGKRIWSAEVPPKNIVMEKYTLEDCVKYHEIEYEIIRGVYWNEGFNDTICNEILKLYKLRQKYQNEKPKNPIEKVYKAILNTAYGKNIIKESDSRTVFIYGEETMHNYDEKNCGKIKNALEYGSEKDPKKKCYRVEIYQNILEHTNNAHCGTMILGMSKRIMNELSYICNLCDSKILYCDTDSAYVFKRDVENIIKKYGEVYKRDLIGTKFGQFKQDLEIKGCENVVGLRFVVKSPKIYCVELEGNKEQTQKEKDEKKELEMKKECKTRCKGVSSISIAYKAKKDFDGDEFKMMALTKGKTTYDLVADGQMRIDIPKSGGIYSKRKFKRKIKNTPFVEIF